MTSAQRLYANIQVDWRPVGRVTGSGAIGQDPFPPSAASPGGWRTNQRSNGTRLIRPLDPLDLLRSAVFGQRGMRNRAFTLGGLLSRRSIGPPLLGLSRRHLSPRAKEHAWVWRRGNRVMGVASVRPRASHRSWEVPALHIGAAAEPAVSELLEQVAASAAAEGAERVFLRLRDDHEVIRAARVGGFFPCISETLYQRLSSTTANGKGALLDGESRMRPMEPSDEYGLFRLYNAATPVPVRSLVAMTFEQWQASREQCPGRHEQRVLEREDAIRGSFDTTISSSVGGLSATVHPDEDALLPDIVDQGLRSLSTTRAVLCLVPEYQVSLGRVLEDRGFEPIDQFVTLIKSSTKTSRYADRVRSALASPESP